MLNDVIAGSTPLDEHPVLVLAGLAVFGAVASPPRHRSTR
jgi:hypothetical protein